MPREAPPIVRLRALSIGRPVFDLLQQSRTGSVLATFARSCYLDLADHIVAVVLPDLLNGPLNLVVAADSAASFNRMPVGTSVSASPASIRVGDAVEISLAQASLWSPALARWEHDDLSRIRANLRIVKSVVRAEAPEGSFAVYLQDAAGLPARAVGAMKALEDGLARRSAELAGSAAAQLAGLGGGLTPSGDDVLVGTLICLSVLPHDKTDFRPSMAAAALGSTTRISEAYLAAAARGEAGEAWHRLRHALAGDDPEEITAAVRRVMAFGETSGADMLAGFLLATHALIDS